MSTRIANLPTELPQGDLSGGALAPQRGRQASFLGVRPIAYVWLIER